MYACRNGRIHERIHVRTDLCTNGRMYEQTYELTYICTTGHMYKPTFVNIESKNFVFITKQKSAEITLNS